MGAAKKDRRTRTELHAFSLHEQLGSLKNRRNCDKMTLA